ncbi:uncharacterized protein LOC123684392 [Harmonia axyridis]|uniref:uncharacterized protein LOC123684392 n=1 Tax=Harmonia axyridis TaxID=115357 RepID=UPI001E277683|nr:uncharacterized protein LOC123684392 [Harmonia axyridis]
MAFRCNCIEVFCQKEGANSTNRPSKTGIHTQTISIIHQNVQSLGNSIDKLEQLLLDNPDCSILCITEHWNSKEQICQLGLKNFKLAASMCREIGKHGGSAIFLKNNINAKECEFISNLSTFGEFECSAIQCEVNKLKMIIVSVYRPPNGSIEVFFEKLECLLFEKIESNSTIFLGGDFNIEMKEDNVTKNRKNTQELNNSDSNDS